MVLRIIVSRPMNQARMWLGGGQQAVALVREVLADLRPGNRGVGSYTPGTRLTADAVTTAPSSGRTAWRAWIATMRWVRRMRQRSASETSRSHTAGLRRLPRASAGIHCRAHSRQLRPAKVAEFCADSLGVAVVEFHVRRLAQIAWPIRHNITINQIL
jgi:hypothetical protein